jgi:hypothetical protein
MAFPAAPAEGEPDSQKATQDLIDDLDKLAAGASHVPDEEMGTLVDEAIDHVRHRRS